MQPVRGKRRKKRMPPLHQWLCALAVAVGAALTVGLGYQLSAPPGEDVQSGQPSSSQAAGSGPGQAQEDGFTYEINRSLTGQIGPQGVEVDLHFANPESNPVSLRVELALEAGGMLLFTSQPVAAGDTLGTALLQEAVQPGQYACIAYITALESQTLEELGSAQQEVQLAVQ